MLPTGIDTCHLESKEEELSEASLVDMKSEQREVLIYQSLGTFNSAQFSKEDKKCLGKSSMWKLVHQGWRFLHTCGGPQRPSETHQGSSRDRPGVSALCHGRICLLADASFGISPI